ncbi:ATP-dependent zinc protease [Vibrio ostreicida]|uniref:ATP-dependent zinc protease n=1 Tax=Vibrio ostreicida TaxID=526588 RepID=A0ABT8BZE8_9VIBR|nr:ATP-dependent zinc protease [Vibrio ostreicida]MDN3611751.1 ATP-dependent zinc protease [Vibrio ostreicida]NPD09565.1 ATP-dependent zinc protease [Vibrio ostreicida]
MKKTWKRLLPVLLCGGLIACTTTDPKPNKPPQKNTKAHNQSKPSPPPKPESIPTEQTTKPKMKKTPDGKLVLGEQEWVYIPGLDQSFMARIDTGATTSSISVVEIVEFERDGKDWIKFQIEHDGAKSKEIALPVARWVKIRQSSTNEAQRRAVVEAWIQIGDLKEKTEFTLADRTHLSFPLLLGRSFFRDVAIVDVSRKWVQDKHK